MKKIIPLILSMVLLLSACEGQYGVTIITTPESPAASAPAPAPAPAPDGSVVSAVSDGSDSSVEIQTPDLPDPEGYYYDLENVVLYLDAYEELPPNYITKSEARALGWEGGSVERYLEGAAIGGDRFGNREGLLPQESGRSYTECDLNTDGRNSRGAERLIFSNDGLYFYTEDHYESFTEVWVENGTVIEG